MGNRSIWEKRPSDVRSAPIVPGHTRIPGTRWPPSQVEPFALRNGVNAESGQLYISGPLSEERKIIVSSS